MNKQMHFFSKATFILFVGMVGLTSCHRSGQMGAGMVQEYGVITLTNSQESLNRVFPAVLKGRQDVDIRPQVTGFITKMAVDEGATVRRGQLLFEIDPVQYQEQVNVAKASVEVAEAALATAELTLESRRELRKKNVISAYDLQVSENEFATRKASVAQAKAQLVSAQKNLTYTRVTSPADGVVGEIPYRVGSLVSPSIAEPLTTVSDISEMYAYFSMTEKQLLSLYQEDQNAGNIVKNMAPVQFQMADGNLYPIKGAVQTISGVIDPATGSVNIRARFSNPQRILRSGGGGKILLPAHFDSCLVIPQRATFEVQDKKFAYVLNADSTITSTPIEVFALDDGQNFIVISGLKAGDCVVTEGVSTLRDGTKIARKKGTAPVVEDPSKKK